MKDTANILSPSENKESGSEREIQKLDKEVFDSLGEQSVITNRSDRVNSVNGQSLVHQGKELEDQNSSSVCSTLGPSASMGVPAPYQNSALVDSDIVVRRQASPEPQPLSREEEELLMNNLEICTITSGACWYVTAEVEATPVEFLINPGAMVTALSVETFDYLHSVKNSQLTLVPLARSVRAANNSKMEVFGYCTLLLDIQGLTINVSAVVCKLNVSAILGMDVLGSGEQEFPIGLNLRDGLLT